MQPSLKQSSPNCKIAYIPKSIRLIFAWVLVAIGSIIMLTPIPGGILLSAPGLLLLYCTSKSMRKHIVKKLRTVPSIDAFLNPFLQKCDSCPMTKPLKECHYSCHLLKIDDHVFSGQDVPNCCHSGSPLCCVRNEGYCKVLCQKTRTSSSTNPKIEIEKTRRLKNIEAFPANTQEVPFQKSRKN